MLALLRLTVLLRAAESKLAMAALLMDGGILLAEAIARKLDAVRTRWMLGRWTSCGRQRMHQP